MRKLAEILAVPTHKLVGDEDQIVMTMSGVILYRHLNRLDKISVMGMIQDLSYPQLRNELRVKCLDSLVNPQWAEWSLTNEELKEALDFHNQLNRWSSLLGGNPGVYGVAGSVWIIIKQGASTKNVTVLVASVILFGVHEFSYSELQKYSNELERRKVLN
ncbi:hypothetical protein I6F65_21330 [Pseudoalteromonas sp. SWXJZ94C]|uniref:hypothetical protein n=1 Tax=Pseudoalteromonas sp. SWXJZ94C TaxID=2792065 RepID=UPI0018CD540F|nr:hypothetical protein [Pseudoalteromonas sp. SWXJZ94C]MBH0059477.1 hypothetical protein [Pseudoalteromonas sp. SWXJZ94C]